MSVEVKLYHNFDGFDDDEKPVKAKKIRRLSVKLSLYLMGILIPTVAVISIIISKTQTDRMQEQTLSEFRTAARIAAKAYGRSLEEAIDQKKITLEEVLRPEYDLIVFSDAQGPFTVEDDRYHSKLADVAGSIGIREIQNEIVKLGVLFASGITIGGYVPVPNDAQNHQPRRVRTDTEAHTKEDKNWNAKNSRQYRVYLETEPRSAAMFRGNPEKGPFTTVQDYLRDTGELAWDVIAPIYVKGHHFGAFRIGVVKDKLLEQRNDLILGLALMFAILIVCATAFTFFVSWYHTKPLQTLAATVNEISVTDSAEVLGTKVEVHDNTEIGRILAPSIDRLRNSLAKAMERLEKPEPRKPTQSPDNRTAAESSVSIRGNLGSPWGVTKVGDE